jgi:DNA modification methylase
MIEVNRIYEGDCLEVLKTFPDGCVNCCITSPPYYGLRDYGNPDQIGLEETPELYVNKLVQVFEQVKRVLKADGTLWLNIGDSYASNTKGTGGATKKQLTNSGSRFIPIKINHGVKEKDLIGIPWLVAFALRSNGWYLRQDIIWHKPNPMPESVTDRCTKSHEYIFLLSKSSKYYYDAESIRQPITDSSIERLQQDIEGQAGSNRVPYKTNGTMKAIAHKSAITPGQAPQGKALKRMSGEGDPIYYNANKRSVWTVNSYPYADAHFATFPERLITDCIKAGCPENGIVLDPFIGAGTTGLVASKLNRNFIGIELNPDYIKIAENRLYKHLGMFNTLNKAI